MFQQRQQLAANKISPIPSGFQWMFDHNRRAIELDLQVSADINAEAVNNWSCANDEDPELSTGNAEYARRKRQEMEDFLGIGRLEVVLPIQVISELFYRGIETHEELTQYAARILQEHVGFNAESGNTQPNKK
jgi:hypothetical protein